MAGDPAALTTAAMTAGGNVAGAGGGLGANANLVTAAPTAGTAVGNVATGDVTGGI